ncbi:hypothetical protein [Cognatilysobacter segetis]|uniref:hypothetical protein n=1 Tax=Cognatilysobacter segetis TaxID=2492394 RepID=UPI00105E290F|nr:hypothetical protein [Lysobacter segetis]
MATNTGNARGWSRPAWGTATGLLLLPAIAMRFPGSGVAWTASDFIVMGALLALTCGAWELARRLSGDGMARLGFAAAVLGGFALVWVNLAVGLVGDGGNPANLMFMGVVAVAIAAALMARGRPRAMVRAMLATAAAHAAVGAIAMLGGWGAPHDGPLRVAAITAFFMLPWLLSAALFHASATRAAAR